MGRLRLAGASEDNSALRSRRQSREQHAASERKHRYGDCMHLAEPPECQALDKPIGGSEGTARNSSDRASRSAERWNQGSMGGRPVSASPAETDATPVRERRQAVDIAGAAEPKPGLRSRRAVVATPRRRWRPPALQGVHASLVRPFPGIRARRQASIGPSPPGDADRPPPETGPVPDFPATFRRMRELRTVYTRRSRTGVAEDLIGPSTASGKERSMDSENVTENQKTCRHRERAPPCRNAHTTASGKWPAGPSWAATKQRPP